MIKRRDYITHIDTDRLVSPTVKGLAGIHKQYTNLGNIQNISSCPHWSILKNKNGKIGNQTVNDLRKEIIETGKAYTFCDAIGNTYIIGRVNEHDDKPTKMGELLDTNIFTKGSATGGENSGFSFVKTFDIDDGDGYVTRANSATNERWRIFEGNNNIFDFISGIENGSIRFTPKTETGYADVREKWVKDAKYGEKLTPQFYFIDTDKFATLIPKKYEDPFLIKLEKGNGFSWSDVVKFSKAILVKAIDYVDNQFLGDLVTIDQISGVFDSVMDMVENGFNYDSLTKYSQQTWALISNDKDIPFLDDIEKYGKNVNQWFKDNPNIQKTIQIATGAVAFYAIQKGKNISKYQEFFSEWGVNLPTGQSINELVESIKTNNLAGISKYLPIGSNSDISKFITAVKNSKLIDMLVNHQDAIQSKAMVLENVLEMEEVNQYLNLLMSETASEAVLTLPNNMVLLDVISKNYSNLTNIEQAQIINLAQGDFGKFRAEELVNLYLESEVAYAQSKKDKGEHFIQRIVPKDLAMIAQSEIQEKLNINSIILE